MTTVRSMAKLSCLICCCLTVTVDDCAAQKKTIEIFRGGKGTLNGKPIDKRIPTGTPDAQGNPAPDPSGTQPSAPVIPKRQDPAVERQRARIAATVQVIGRNLSNKSFDSFRRGLMPLQDHLDQLNVATQSNHQLASGASSQLEVAVGHRSNLARIVDTLTKAKAAIGLPAAPGYSADLALARAMLAQANVEIASLENDPDAIDAASAQAVAFAQKHLAIRRVDVDFGFASLSMLTKAIMLTPDGFADGRQVLQDTVAQRRKWARANPEGGLGRVDHLAESELELARFNYYSALESGDPEAAAEQLAFAKNAADRMYNARVRYNRSGTSTVYDVARAWNLRREVHLMAGQKASNEELVQDATEFERVFQLANSTTDLRGRNAADISYVALLKVVNNY